MSTCNQSISVTHGVGMLVSVLLGSGVFIIPAIAASVAGEWSLLAWFIMGLLILPIVFTFAALGKKHPHAGGTAYFVQLAFGDKAARIVSWLFIWVVALGAPVIVITGANFLVNGLNAAGGIDQSTAQILFLCALLMLFLLLVFNLFGLKTAAIIQTLLSICIVSCLVFVSLNSQVTQPFHLPDTDFQLSSVALSATYILWCFLGIEAIAHLANDFKNPHRDFPLTIIIGIVITLIVYSLISLSLLQMHFYGDEAENLNSVINLVKLSLGQQGYMIVSFAGFLTCYISVSLYFVGFSRLLSSMAKQQQLVPLFSRENAYAVPYYGLLSAIILTGAMLLAYHYSGLDLEGLIAYANGLFILIYLAASLAGTKLLTGINRNLALLASATCLVLFISLATHALFAIGLLLLLSLYYRLKSKKRS
ncbi:L-methionine/branched-chain amino acid transporter [Psychromonas sp. Urea-02u-13]|uniref:L-methionine/branched-chain amino acid transporter n=1 Tax=Psychromonas sp. Urea-02u-13 TaxID=2058326 RepID=UPI0012FF32CB|nr:L-methionine/branched-chain amino acid transporter [Psychromonas sp. Urea-02u-13]